MTHQNDQDRVAGDVGRTDITVLHRRLRGAGLRVTAPRVAVLSWLAEHQHAKADAVSAGVRADLGSVSTQAVYDVLNAFTRVRLVRRIEPAGHPARFETRAGDNHHHLVCRRCGRTEDVDCAVGPAPCLTPSTWTGYAVDEAEVVFWGLCPDCLVATADAGRETDAADENEDIKVEGPRDDR